MPQLDTELKRDFFIENLLFHRARKLYFRMMSFLGKLTVSRGRSTGQIEGISATPETVGKTRGSGGPFLARAITGPVR